MRAGVQANPHPASRRYSHAHTPTHVHFHTLLHALTHAYSHTPSRPHPDSQPTRAHLDAPTRLRRTA